MIDDSKISIIMPVYNEEKYIEKSLKCIIDQNFRGFIEIIIVDGSSEDNTLGIIEKIKEKLPENRQIKVFSNPKRYIPVSLNIACENASFDIIIRIDGHTNAPLNYVEECIKGLRTIKYEGIVGGRCDILPSDSNPKSVGIAKAVSNKIGVGNATYRVSNGYSAKIIEVDTVPFGAFTKELWLSVGKYDEKLLYDEDFDFNYRAKKAGYKILMNTSIVLNYFARRNFKLLWRQYFRYGYWANRFCIKHRTIPNLRRFIPLMFLLFLFMSFIISFKLFSIVITLYLVCISCVSVYETIFKSRYSKATIYMAVSIMLLHFSYGSGSLISIMQLCKVPFDKR